jgi:hypothetical protein
VSATAQAEAELGLLLLEANHSRRRIPTGDTGRMTTIAIKYLTRYKPHGLIGWSVRAQVGESPRAYARRAIRCLIARCTQAGVSCPLSAPNAEGVGLRDGHGSGARGGAVRLVSQIERALARDGAEPGVSLDDEERAALE